MPPVVIAKRHPKIRFCWPRRRFIRRLSSSADSCPHTEVNLFTALNGHSVPAGMMARSSLPATNTTQRSLIVNSPPPAISPLAPIAALDLSDYGAEPYLDSSAPLQRSSPNSPEISSTIVDRLPHPHVEQAQSNLADVANCRVTPDTHLRVSRQSYHAAGSRTSLLASPPPAEAPRNPSSAPTTPYLSAFASSTEDVVAPCEEPHVPTAPTAEALSAYGAPPGTGPRHIKKIQQRISIWAEEMAEVNEKQPTRPMPKPLREWERLGRRVLRRREQDEWPGPICDGEILDKTWMYDGRRQTLSEDQYWGPHPSLNRDDGQGVDRATSSAPPTPGLEGDDVDSPSFPTRNILIANVDGAADSPDELKLSPMTSSDGDVAQKAKIATAERLNRAAKLLAKQTKSKEDEGSSDEKPLSEKLPLTSRQKDTLMSWNGRKVWAGRSAGTSRAYRQ